MFNWWWICSKKCASFLRTEHSNFYFKTVIKTKLTARLAPYRVQIISQAGCLLISYAHFSKNEILLMKGVEEPDLYVNIFSFVAMCCGCRVHPNKMNNLTDFFLDFDFNIQTRLWCWRRVQVAWGMQKPRYYGCSCVSWHELLGGLAQEFMWITRRKQWPCCIFYVSHDLNMSLMLEPSFGCWNRNSARKSSML